MPLKNTGGFFKNLIVDKTTDNSWDELILLSARKNNLSYRGLSYLRKAKPVGDFPPSGTSLS